MKKEISMMLLKIKAVSIRRTDDLFTWASGIKSPIYCDNRLVISYPEAREMVAEEFVRIIKDKYPDVELIAATSTAGIPHGAWIAQKMNLPMVYVRGTSKGHGRQNQIEGKVEKGQKTVLIEDLISTGNSSYKAVEALRESGLDLMGVVAIFSYNFDAATDLFNANEVDFHTITDYKTLLPIAVELGYISEEQLDVLKLWSSDPRVFTE